MKILLCSDIHGSVRAANLIKDLLDKNKYDYLFLIGDILYNGPRNKVQEGYDPGAVFQILNNYKDKIIAVRGNCDADVDLMVLDFAMPKMRAEKLNNVIYYLTHGDDDSIFNDEPKENEVYIKGHTHIPLMYLNSNNGLVLNPGSMTYPKGSINKSFMEILDDDVLLTEFDYFKEETKIVNTYSLKSGKTFK